jgi:hypothetical protein
MKLEELEEYIAPCVFHDDRHEDCIQHSGQVPCMTQTESDWLNSEDAERAALEAERDEYKRAAEHYVPVAHALAAHVEELREALKLARRYIPAGPLHGHPDSIEKVDAALGSSPTTSLARIKAQWQAEALRQALADFRACYPVDDAYVMVLDVVSGFDACIRQAEESANV